MGANVTWYGEEMAAVLIVVAFLIVFGVMRAVVIVPNSSAYIIERLGRYQRTLSPGFHIITPIMERIAVKHTLAGQTETMSATPKDRPKRSEFEF